jgi:hypothetical protein
MIIEAHDAGMPAETIKEVLTADIGTRIDIGADGKGIENS